MDTEPNTQPTVSLPATCARVKLPRPPNFLHLALTDATIPVASVEPGDAVLLALAIARRFMAHHRERWEAAQRLSRPEREQLPHPSLVHPGIVERIAREQGLTDVAWHLAEPTERARACNQVRATLALFLEEITRG